MKFKKIKITSEKYKRKIKKKIRKIK